MQQLFVTTSRVLTSQNLNKKENYLKLLTSWMPKREQIVTLPTVADLSSDNPRPILVEFIIGFVFFAKRINTPGTLAQGRNSAWICTLKKRSGRLLQENVITESWLSSPESLWLLKRSTISHAIAISAPEISQSLGITKKSASIPNISQPNCRDMTTLEPICYKILGFWDWASYMPCLPLLLILKENEKCRIVLLQDTRLNPFNPDLQDLFCLWSGKVASSEVQDLDLLRAKDVGEDVDKAFKEQYLECDPPKVKFHDTIKKAKLKTFADLNKKTKVKASNN